jgi:acyl-CoA dehydrogenase
MIALSSVHGVLLEEPAWALVVGGLALILVLGYHGAPLWLWTLYGLAAAVGLGLPMWAIIVVAVIAAVMNLCPIRQRVLTAPLMALLKKLNVLPAISETERVALEAGTTWVDAEFFSGKPDFERILDERYGKLSDKEQAFVDGPVNELCGLVSDWQVHCERDFPPEVWAFLKKERFFGMIIPEEYGGLGFSALGHSTVIMKLAARSIPLAVTTMVPNSLGPAELLLHYGTDEQKDHFLPRLARGEEIPCFALTEPSAGSDAGSISSHGELFRGEDGELHLRLTWRKRYITLAAISTVLGLAFKLRDPQNLLGRGEDLGITCALIPTASEGVRLGRRHDPLGVPFYNCPTEGDNVVIPASSIIGGVDGAGKGWRMLMECLAAGRAISLPALSTGSAKLVSHVTGSYAVVRKQFGLSIGRFEGIEEKLAEVAGLTYLMEASRVFTAGAVDSGAKPSVVSAIAKYNFTELARHLVNNGMDVIGGAGISRGPRNLLANTYQAVPISITVEGANILTRTMIIFGQGVIRCHPFAQKEVDALLANDLGGFDKAFWSHVGFTGRNACRALLLSVTRGLCTTSPVSGKPARYYRKLAWASASFAFFADLALGVYGGSLKRREKLTGRFADVLSWLYLASATLRRFDAEGTRAADWPAARWALDYSFARIQEAFDGIFANFAIPGLSWLMRGPLALWSRLNPIGTEPSDRVGALAARALQRPGPARNAIMGGLYSPSTGRDPLAVLDRAYALNLRSEDVIAVIKDAVRRRELPRRRPEALIEEALAAHIISEDQAELLREARDASNEAIRVDAFKLDDYRHHAAAVAG